MVSLDDAIVARFNKKDHHFEILVDPKAIDLAHQNKEVNILNYLATDMIFKDARKAEKASEDVIEDIFGTTDTATVALHILRHGEYQLTTQQRKAMLEQKRRAVIDWIARMSMDPHTKTPHPRDRIERAMEEAGVHVDMFKPVEEQVKTIVPALRPVIPLSIENVRIDVRIPAQYAGRAYGEVINMAKIIKEEWLSDGSFKCVAEIPAGMQTQFYDKLNALTKGDVETRLLK
jgi:ribosome maturation protein SDO1